MFALGAVHKRRPQSGGSGFLQYRHLSDKEDWVSPDVDFRSSTLFGAKNGIFRNLWCVCKDKGERG